MSNPNELVQAPVRLTRRQAITFCEVVFRNLPYPTDYAPLIDALSDEVGWPAVLSRFAADRASEAATQSPTAEHRRGA